MTYIIDQANVLKENKVLKCSILVKDNNIDYISTNLNRHNIIKMDFSNYLLTPGHVMMNYSLASNTPFQTFKESMKEQLLIKGCTTVVVVCDVEKEREIGMKIERAKNHMLNSPIDYYIGIKIPLKLLTPSFIRVCKRKKIPVVIVEIDDEKELLNIPWGWIKEALYPSFFPILPMWKSKNRPFFHGNRHTNLWNGIMKENGIPSTESCPEENTPLQKDFLKRIGIYPAKGEIRIRGEIDYNLYDLNDLSYSIEEKPLLDYHSHIPSMTMHKGKFTKIKSKVYFRPGFGKECKVKIPGHFATNF